MILFLFLGDLCEKSIFETKYFTQKWIENKKILAKNNSKEYIYRQNIDISDAIFAYIIAHNGNSNIIKTRTLFSKIRVIFS